MNRSCLCTEATEAATSSSAWALKLRCAPMPSGLD